MFLDFQHGWSVDRTCGVLVEIIYVDYLGVELYIDTLINCDNSEFTEGHISIRVPGKLSVFPIQGSMINLNLGLKCVEFPNMQIQVFSGTEETASIEETYSELGDIHLGLVQPCEILDDNFDVEVDGMSFITAPTQYYRKLNSETNWLILEGLSSKEQFTLEIEDYNGESTYQTNISFRLNASPQSLAPSLSAINTDITIVITKDDGTFIEGSFTGSGVDDLGQTRSLQSTFKIKKAP